jgi:hypothetical protein
MMKRWIVLNHLKRAQAAMEFLMTYGWALLVVLVAIGALAFFGVLNPGQFLPDQCVLFAGVSCISSFADANSDQLKFTFQNGLGYTMGNFTANVTLTGATSSLAAVLPNSCLPGTNLVIVDGKTQKCDYAISPLVSQGDKVKGKIALRWTDSTGNVRVKEGNFALTAEGP